LTSHFYESPNHPPVPKYLAEFLGTFILVFGGVGSAVLAGSHTRYVGVALAFGLELPRDGLHHRACFWLPH